MVINSMFDEIIPFTVKKEAQAFNISSSPQYYAWNCCCSVLDFFFYIYSFNSTHCTDIIHESPRCLLCCFGNKPSKLWILHFFARNGRKTVKKIAFIILKYLIKCFDLCLVPHAIPFGSILSAGLLAYYASSNKTSDNGCFFKPIMLFVS